MNKEDILKKSREENEGKPDECELRILADASRIGIAVGGILSVIIVVFSRIINEPLLGLSAWAVYFLMLGCHRIYHFIKLREKFRLVQGIIGLGFGLASFIGMLILGLS